MNLYRGCTHGCIYCDSRSKCYQMEHDFEDVQVKRNAPQLLEQALRRKKKRCMIGTGAMSDPYLPIEEEYRLTRRCLELIEEYGFGVSLLTKSDLVLRDLDVLKRIATKTRCVVQMTLTTYDEQLCRIVEPNVCTTARRAQVLRTLHEEGIETVVWFCPILPFLNDTRENVQGILHHCEQAHVKKILSFGMGMTLREGNREYYYQKLDQHFPGVKQQYIKSFGNRYAFSSLKGEELTGLFLTACRRKGIETSQKRIFSYLSTFEDKQEQNQLRLF